MDHASLTADYEENGAQGTVHVQDDRHDLCVNGARCFGIPSTTDADRLFSPSFSRTVAEELPLAPTSGRVSFGGQWFWEVYQHCVLREDVTAFLGGTGVNLEEDSLDTQKLVRARSLSEEQIKSRYANVWRHSSAKIEVMYALSLSIALRIVREPMLDDNQGPQAVILCATKDQCDEMAFVLNRFCTDLHLVVHNLFEPYPAMPVGKLAEVVVGTPPLWESVCVLQPKEASSAKGNLEDVLTQLFPRSAPPTYSATRVRPYSLQRVVELAMLDFDRQCQLGFSVVLESIVQRSPPSCRKTRVYGQSQLGTPGSGLAARSSAHVTQKDMTTVITFAPASSETHKRARDETPDENCKEHAVDCALLLWSALSAPRLLLDHDTFWEFKNGVEAEALRFWESFEGKPVSSGDFAEFASCQLLLVCHQDPNNKSPVYLSEVCLSVLPTSKGLEVCASRLTLLFSHLEDRLSGTVFDGSVVTCSNLSRNRGTGHREVVLVTSDTRVHPSVTLLHDHLHEVAGIPTRIALEKRVDETPAIEAADVARHRACVATLLAEAAMDFIADSSSAPFPHGFFLRTNCPTEAFTVVVVRNLASSKEALCSCNPLDDSAGKSIVQTILEECCQYGRVLSYLCHRCDDKCTEGHASVFIEFASEASAVEAVRLLSYRFSHPQAADGPRVRLFRNATYYEGAYQAERKKHASLPDDDPKGGLFDDLMEMDLLSE